MYAQYEYIDLLVRILYAGIIYYCTIPFWKRCTKLDESIYSFLFVFFFCQYLLANIAGEIGDQASFYTQPVTVTALLLFLITIIRPILKK